MPQTLLLADDSVTIQRVIELTFADEAIKVVAVSDGDQAIERIESDPPDIVLVDIGMPGRSGYEVAQHIKQSPRLKHIPVLLLTGAFEPVDQARAVAAGCDGVLAKPFEPQLVIARVKELLARGGGGAAPAPPAAESSPRPVSPGKTPPAPPLEVARLVAEPAAAHEFGGVDGAGHSSPSAMRKQLVIVNEEIQPTACDAALSSDRLPIPLGNTIRRSAAAWKLRRSITRRPQNARGRRQRPHRSRKREKP